MTRKQFFVAGLLISAVIGSTGYGLYVAATAQRDKVAANVARLNEKYASEGKLERYTEYVSSGRLAGRTNNEIWGLLGEPQTGFSECDGSEMCGWIIGAREGDRSVDQYAADFFVKLLVVERRDGKQTIEIREEHYPK